MRENTLSGISLYVVISYGKFAFSFLRFVLRDAVFCFAMQKDLLLMPG